MAFSSLRLRVTLCAVVFQRVGAARSVSALSRRGVCFGAGAGALAAATGAGPALAKPAASDGSWAKRSEPFTDADFAGFTTSPSGLQYKTFEEGFGVKPTAGQGIKAHYAGYLLDGSKFDSSYDRRSPLGFAVGTGRVIKGWDEALLDMKVGEKRVRAAWPTASVRPFAMRAWPMLGALTAHERGAPTQSRRSSRSRPTSPMANAVLAPFPRIRRSCSMLS